MPIRALKHRALARRVFDFRPPGIYETASGMSRKAKFDHTDSSFDDFLEAEGIREEVEAAAIKAVIAADLQRVMVERNISRSALARKLATSRAHVDRLLDPRYTPVSLDHRTRRNIHGQALAIQPAGRCAKTRTSGEASARTWKNTTTVDCGIDENPHPAKERRNGPPSHVKM